MTNDNGSNWLTDNPIFKGASKVGDAANSVNSAAKSVGHAVGSVDKKAQSGASSLRKKVGHLLGLRKGGVVNAVAKGKATATGSGPNQATPQRTIERFGNADGPMARGGNDEAAYGKASGSGK